MKPGRGLRPDEATRIADGMWWWDGDPPVIIGSFKAPSGGIVLARCSAHEVMTSDRSAPSLHRSVEVKSGAETAWHGWLVQGKWTTDSAEYDAERIRCGYPK